MPSGLELEPKPGMLLQRFIFFCALAASSTGLGLGMPMVFDLAVLVVVEVLEDEPVETGDW